MKHIITDLLNTYEQNIEVAIILKDGKWILTCEGEEVASIPEEREENADDAAATFEKMGCFGEIEEWCETEYRIEQQELYSDEMALLAWYWQNTI